MKIRHEVPVEEKRRRAMPSLEEQVAALMEGGTTLAEMRARVAEVNRKYPRPVPR